MPTTPKTNPVAWFEIATEDPDQAMTFYREMFGWSFKDDEHAGTAYRIIDTGPGGIGGGLADTKGEQTSHGIFYVLVPDVAAACAKAETLGGKVLMPPTEGGGGLVFAYLLDAVGTHIGVFSEPR